MNPQSLVDRFNRRHKVGTTFKLTREPGMEPKQTRTISLAFVLNGKAVVTVGAQTEPVEVGRLKE